MKCPKCGYLGFESVERCRNCGYEFSLSPPSDLPELAIRSTAGSDAMPLGDLDLTNRPTPASADALRYARDTGSATARAQVATPPELPLFRAGATQDDTPLITRVSPPRPPLSVRRATPEVPRLRTEARPAAVDLPLPGLDEPAIIPRPRPAIAVPAAPVVAAASASHETLVPAASARRALAGLIDLLLLFGIDTGVVYLTAKICGLSLSFDDLRLLPRVPLLAFLIAQNACYFVAFTLGGQTLGKMIAGIRVVGDEDDRSPSFSRAIVRTLVWGVLAVPAGLGFASIWLSHDGRGLHDQLAGTRVVRASAGGIG